MRWENVSTIILNEQKELTLKTKITKYTFQTEKFLCNAISQGQILNYHLTHLGMNILFS